MTYSQHDKIENTETTKDSPKLDEARREALAKMGRFAAYTAPVMLGLLGATKARATAGGSLHPC